MRSLPEAKAVERIVAMKKPAPSAGGKLLRNDFPAAAPIIRPAKLTRRKRAFTSRERWVSKRAVSWKRVASQPTMAYSVGV